MDIMNSPEKGVFNKRTDSLPNNLTLGGGKIPPQAPELEISVLATILAYSESLIEIETILKPEHFYVESHKLIYTAIVKLSRDRSPIDGPTVAAQLSKMGKLEVVGGFYFIAELMNRALSFGSNLEYHARLIIQKYMQREMIRISAETITEAYNDTTDIFDLIENNQRGISDVINDTHTKEGQTIDELLEEALKELEHEPENGLTGVPTEFFNVDQITNGWQKSDLIIIAARPAMGKTAFVINCARNAAVKQGKSVLVFSLEMSSIQLTWRMIAAETGIHLSKILHRNLSLDEKRVVLEKTRELKEAKLKIDDSASLNIFEFRAKARRHKQKYGLDLIVIDYLQLMHGDGSKFNNRDAEIGTISRALKSVAKELDVPVIALAQLSRAVDARPGANGKRPVLSDLRESGNIEQDADLVGFLYRPEYYGIFQDAHGNSTSGLTELIFAKNRHGLTDTAKLAFNGSIMKFEDWQQNETVPVEELNQPAPQGALFFEFGAIKHKGEDEDAPF